MRKRSWVIRVGDHWFLRNIRDIYESIASKHTSRDEPRGIQSLYPDNLDSPFWLRHRVSLLHFNPDADSYEDRYPSSGYDTFFKDERSAFSFDHPIQDDTELNLFLVGKPQADGQGLRSIESSPYYRFSVNYQFIARYVDRLLKHVKVKPTRQQPMNITLVASYSAAFRGIEHSSAIDFLMNLHQRGHRNIVLAAPQGKIASPHWGKKMRGGNVVHFYLGNRTIYRIAKEKDWRAKALKVLTQCMHKTRIREKKDYLEACIREISSIGYITRCDRLNRLKSILQIASDHPKTRLYVYGTKRIMRFFNCHSHTETKLKELIHKIGNDVSICSVEKNLNP